jgi:FixJ family two-component response regulator
MVMPDGINGRQLAEKLLAKDPALRVIYTSGYSQNIAGQDVAGLKGHDFLAKPYDPALLLQKIRACLDVHPGRVPSA